MTQKYALLLLIFSLLAGCGPLGAHSAIAKAHIAFEAANAVEAEKFAVYEYRSAALYLRKAKEEEGFSSFQEAMDFARLARNFADKARARAVQNKKAKPRSLQETQRARFGQQSPQQPSAPVAPSAQPRMAPPVMPSAPAQPAAPTAPAPYPSQP